MNKLNVIIADDAPFVRDILRHILKRAGHNIIAEAEDGVQAVLLSLEKKPDLVIMDIVMPHKSGVQATKEILEVLPHIKIIACSTIDQDNVLLKVMEAGAVDYIKKPFHANDVIKIIEKAFSSNAGDQP